MTTDPIGDLGLEGLEERYLIARKRIDPGELVLGHHVEEYKWDAYRRIGISASRFVIYRNECFRCLLFPRDPADTMRSPYQWDAPEESLTTELGWHEWSGRWKQPRYELSEALSGWSGDYPIYRFYWKKEDQP